MLRKDRWWTGWIGRIKKIVKDVIGILRTIQHRRVTVTIFVGDTIMAISQMKHTKPISGEPAAPAHQGYWKR